MDLLDIINHGNATHRTHAEREASESIGVRAPVGMDSTGQSSFILDSTAGGDVHDIPEQVAVYQPQPGGKAADAHPFFSGFKRFKINEDQFAVEIARNQNDWLSGSVKVAFKGDRNHVFKYIASYMHAKVISGLSHPNSCSVACKSPENGKVFGLIKLNDETQQASIDIKCIAGSKGAPGSILLGQTLKALSVMNIQV